MSDTDDLMRALRELPTLDVSPDRARSILARAEAALPKETKTVTLAELLWERFLAPTLVGATVASYLVWAVTAAGALYR
jgi:hypothetical protein